MIESTQNGVAENSMFKYNDNQIISTDNSKEEVRYTYNDELITTIINYNKKTKTTVTLDYSYIEGKLVKVTSSEKYEIDYAYNSDGSVSYQKYVVNSQNQKQKDYHGTLSFKNDNLIKDERFFDQKNQDLVASSKISYTYDTHNNPYASIIGFDKLLDHGAAISKNNNLMTVAESQIVEGDQTTSSANMYTTTYKYDSDNYPTEQVSEASATNPNYSKIQYLY
ncbi:MAG: hypothetical protein ABI554_01455 [Flavobacterium sp.]